MTLKKLSLVITLLLSVCFVYAQGTEIDIEIRNNSPSGYHIDIILHQQSAQPSVGSLSYNILGNSTNVMHLEFDDVDICIDNIECTYTSTCEQCATSASIDVNCLDENYSFEEIAPYNSANRKCYTFEYWNFENPNYCEYLYYDFRIY